MFKTISKMLKTLFDMPAESGTPSIECEIDEIGLTAESLEIKPELTKPSWKILSKQFPKHMSLYLVEFPDIDVQLFCELATKNALAGYRADRLTNIIQENFKIPATKAETLACQATSVYMTLFQRLKHGEAGVTRFIWRTAGDQRVCPECARLNGKTFLYTGAPVIHCTGRDVWTGEYCGCRCIEEPLLDPVEM